MKSQESTKVVCANATEAHVDVVFTATGSIRE